jgi:DNA-directed RNA polymerase specialized sigma24 family protein
MASLDAALPRGGGAGGEWNHVPLADVLPDVGALAAAEAAQLRCDVDDALRRLPARLRAVVVARYLDGESAAAIGRRYGRTEQTVTAWLRRALHRMKAHLGESRRSTARKDER